MSTTPVTRALPVVIRELLKDDSNVLRLVVGEIAAVQPPTPDIYGYMNVVVGGSTLRVPRVQMARGAPGEPCYLLVTDSLILALGSASIAV